MVQRLLVFCVAALLFFSIHAHPGLANSSAPDNDCASPGQNGTAARPYLICSISDLALLRNHPDAHFELRTDLSLGIFGWTTISSFSGHLDGNGHTISYLFSPRGLFNVIEEGATVKNLNVTGAIISGYFEDAILASRNRGTIVNVEVSGTVSGLYTLGLLVARNEGLILNSRAHGQINGSNGIGGIAAVNAAGGQIVNAQADASISAAYVSGGIAGTNQGVIDGAIAYGTITAHAGVHGGIVGDNAGIVIRSRSYNDIHYHPAYGGIGLVYGLNSGTVSDSCGHGQLIAEE